MRKVLVCATVVLTVAWLPSSVFAAPTIVNDLAFIENRPADDIFGVTGLKLQLDVNATDPGGSAALTGAGAGATATASNAAFPSNPVTLPFNSFFGLLGVEFTANLTLTAADFSKVTGMYTYTVTNTSTQSTSDTGHNLDKLEVISFPTTLHTSDLSTTPVFSFTDPNPTPGIANVGRRYDYFIFDGITHQAIFEFAPSNGNMLSATPSFTIPAGLLVPGHPYIFRANSIDIDLTEAVSTLHPRWESRAGEYLSFTPLAVPEPSSVFVIGSGLAGLIGVVLRRRRRT